MKVKYLYEGNIYKNFILFAFPMVISGILANLYNTVDTIIAGVCLGDKALGAIGALSPLISVFSNIICGMGVGFGIYVALMYGKKEFDKMIKAINTFTLVSFILSIVFTLFSVFCCEWILDVFKVAPEIRTDAGIYFKTYMIGIFFITFANCGVYILNALSSGSFPLYMSILSAVLNIGGNLLTVLVFGMGVMGLALSSVVASLAVSVVYVIKIWVFGKKLGVKNVFAIDFHVFFLGTGYMLPPTFQQLIMYAISMFLSPLVNGLGYAMTSAYTIIYKVYEFVTVVYQNSSKTLGNYVAQCVGAKKYDLIKHSILVAIVQGLIFVLPFLILCAVIPEAITSLFLSGDYAAETFEYSIMFIKIFMPMVAINSINNIFHNLYRGLKDKAILVISSAFGGVVRLTLSYILTAKLGMLGFYIGWAISWAAEAIFSLIIYLTGVWVPKDLKSEILGKKAEPQKI